MGLDQLSLFYSVFVASKEQEWADIHFLTINGANPHAKLILDGVALITITKLNVYHKWAIPKRNVASGIFKLWHRWGSTIVFIKYISKIGDRSLSSPQRTLGNQKIFPHYTWLTFEWAE